MREPRSPASSALPRSFGDYELLEEIARGGMGIVYKARQKSLGRFVAVKFLLRGPLAGGDFIKRFRIEASAAAALQHPNIVAIHEVGVREGEHFLAMDYVDGPNLARLVKDHPLAPKTAAHYLKTVAEAIHYAHEKGILHRDLKPSNVLIDSNDQPRVTDFGLAKRLVTESQPPLDVTQLTLTGHVLGSAGYMSPEQATGAKGKMGRASDVYSLGAMLYHLLTGRPPFAGGSLAETLNQIQNQEPVALRLLNPTVPRDLETICLKCLEKDPAHRFPTAKLMAEELGRFLRHEPILLRPVSRPEKVWRWARRKPALAALFVLVQLVGAVGLTGILWQWNRAERLAKERGQERDRAESAVRDLQLKRVEDLLEMNRASVALARLAQILRQDPANPTASLRTVSLLSHRTFALPAAPPLRHGGRVNGASFSPDGLRVVTASNDQTAQQWIARTGEKIGPPLVHDGPVNAAAFSPNGRHLVTASDDHTAKVWEAATGALFGWALVHSNRVLSAQFSPDGASILTVGADQAAYLWDTTSGALRHVLRHQGVITSARFSVDGQRVVTASNDGTAALWDAASGQRLRRVTHGQRVMWAELSPDGSRLAAAGYDDQASLWDTATGQRLARIRHRLDVVECVAFRPDGREFATCGRDRTVRLHDGRTGNATDKQFVHDAIVFRLEYSRDGQRLLAHCLDGTLWVWETASGRLGCEPIHHLLPVNEAHFSPDGQWVVAAGNDQAAHVWDARPGAMLGVRLPHGQNVRIGFSPDGRRVATASLDGSARVWDSRTGEPVTPPMWHTHWLMEPRFDASGKWLLSCSIDGTACVWNAETGEPRFPMVRHGGRIDFAAFSPDGRLFVTTCRDGTIRLWNATNGQPASPLLHHDATPAWIYAARFSPDGRHLVTCSASGSARIWDVATGQRRGDPMLHEAQVNDARFSPDGRRIVTASFDMTARVWDGQTGQPLSPPLRHRGRLKVAMFSPDGGRLVTCGEFDTVQLWDAKNWQPLGEEMRQLGDVRELSAFSPDGAWVATGSVEGQARVWHAFTGKPLPEPLQAGSILTSMAFGAERSWLGLGFGDSFGMVIELPEAPTPAPDWLAPLAEAVAGLRLADSGREEFVPATVLLEMRERLPRLDGDGSYARWARWFFSDRSTRTLSPRSPITVPDYARRCVEEATPRGLAEALRLFPTNHPARLAGSPRDDQAGLSRIPLTAPRFPGRDPRCSINCLDLSPYYNAALREEWHQPTNASTGWSLRGLPAGRWRLGGVEFDVRGLIQLAGQGIQAQRPPYPVGVTNLVVGRACAGLHFLHASIWAIPLPSGTRIGRYIVRYVDGRTHDIPIVHRQNSLEWQGHEEQVRGLKDTVLAWRGRMPNGKPCRLLRYGWSNPRPSVPIHSLDFVSEMTLAGPFLVAITLDESQPKVTRREFPSRNPDCPTNCLDLSASYTSLLTEDWHGDRWAGNNLAVLPAGTHKLAGVEFDVRGIIQMSGLEIEKHAPGFPEVVEGIPVHQKVRRIHFLHAVAWGNHVASGTVIGQYELAYRGGGLATVPLRTGQELAEWKTGGTFPHLPLARVAWTGTNAWRSPIQLFKYSWENPRPDAVIETLAIRSQKTAAALFLVAATTE